jgi:hypothetical protein
MHSWIGQSTAELTARWPGWSVYWVPTATGKPVVTWHAKRRDGTGQVLHAEYPDELEALLRLSER